MSLNAAHEGYEYQDLLTVYFILQDILNNNQSKYFIDRKEFDEDKIDDLTIVNVNGTFKKQIKYSNYTNDHTLEKKNLSQLAGYQLALDILFRSWEAHPQRSTTEIRLCLAWNEPNDELINILKSCTNNFSFKNNLTKLFQIDVDKLWSISTGPLASWKRFKKESSTINRSLFSDFCNKLIIELDFPKFSLDIRYPGPLETIVLKQVSELGIGVYPNDNETIESFILGLLYYIKNSRSLGNSLSTKEIFLRFQIQTNYGAIEQSFPVDHAKKILLDEFTSYILEKVTVENKIILKGSPGSGKSWALDNIINELKMQDIKVIKHYCYTDLDDEFQKERITLNVFYGNLINDILEAFPELKHSKEQLYASNITELNILLSNISSNTVLIIDGLDHIERIFEYREWTGLAKTDIAIIDAINKLTVSQFVKILITSQPIEELKYIENYQQEEIPSWGIFEIQTILDKFKIENFKLKEDKYLSDLLLEKSEGNPLYLTYALTEIQTNSSNIYSVLESLPTYSYNLSNYYKYMLAKLDTRLKVPQILSGVNFSISNIELKEITGEGDYVDETLNLISPLIKQNFSQNGYIIYHESFRRYILDELKSKNISLDRAIFKPIIDWFDEKGFYSYPKAYRYYLQFLYNGQYFSKIVNIITNDFPTESLYHGHFFEEIKNNYTYMLKAAIKEKDLPILITLNAINTVLSTTKDTYDDSFISYCHALGESRGYGVLSSYLTVEDKPTVELKQGLEVCYLCSSNKEVAPWEAYIKYFDKNISLEDFKYYIRYHLDKNNLTKLMQINKKIIDDNLEGYKKIFENELIYFNNKELLNKLNISKSHDDEKIIIADAEVIKLLKKIIDFKNVFEDEVIKIDTFFKYIETKVKEVDFINTVCSLLEGKNWFYNWIIFYIKIKVIKSLEDQKFSDLHEALKYLTFDTEPFKGAPRTCDIYSLEPYIYDSIDDSVKLISTQEDWEICIDILVELSDKTTTSIQGSNGGPLSTDKLFKLLENNVNDLNIEYIILVLEKVIKTKEEYHLHEYISEYNFILSKLYAKTDNTERALEKLKIGIQYLLGYTFRKDITLLELTDCIESISVLDTNFGNEYIQKIKSLVDSVVEHTDGKETKNFPNIWFEAYLNINFYEASLYLQNQLLESRYDWRLEKSLVDLLIKSNGNINPRIELFICQTFITESSELFLSYCINLVNKVKDNDEQLARSFLSQIYIKLEVGDNSDYSNQFLDYLKTFMDEFSLDNKEVIIQTTKQDRKYADKRTIIQGIESKYLKRNELSKISISGLQKYYADNNITISDLNILGYLFDSFIDLTDEIKSLIKIIVFKYEQNNYYNDFEIDIIFETNQDIKTYFLVCKFIYAYDGWYKSFVNIEAFEQAYKLNTQLTLDSLFELLNEKFGIGYHRSGVAGNLINALIKANFDETIIKGMWNNLYSAIDYRLPYKEEFDWKSTLSNDLQMDIEEVFISILFTRFKSNTTQRHNVTLSSIAYILWTSPEKLIKPIKWFLQNHDKFLEVTAQLILELLYEFHNKDINYCLNFKLELENMYPTNYYSNDFIIEELTSISDKNISKHLDNTTYPCSDTKYHAFLFLNNRHSVLDQNGLDFKKLVGEYAKKFQEDYKGKFDLYYNRMNKKMVDNIYPSNYLLKLINKNFYNHFRLFEAHKDFYTSINIDIKTLVAQTISNKLRPFSLEKASNMSDDFIETESFDIESKWVRIAHYEKELLESERNKFVEFDVRGELIFKSIVDNTIFKSRELLPHEIWANEIEDDNSVIRSLFQPYDSLEKYRVLWLNKNLLTKLNLTTDLFINGLQAKNEEEDIVLKYNRWQTDYLGHRQTSDIKDEIAKLDGAELLIRKDYFIKLCLLFPKTKSFYISIRSK